MMAKNGKYHALAVLGSGSDVGKSLITAAICRLLSRAGFRVAPFKAQNMSLNSGVTRQGGEMGRAQVLQAQACGLDPHVDMNPVLLKPEADHTSQIIVQGKIWPRKAGREYYHYKKELFEHVKASFQRLANEFEFIVMEGAGSAAELNLRDRDMVNWAAVKMADAAVVLVADIDRGGVFAQTIGTLQLLEPDERQRVMGIVINKFRGDVSLFHDGVRIIEQRSGVPVLGVIPYMRNLQLDQEDSVEVERFRCTPYDAEKVNIGVILLPHMSNFTDFNQLVSESDVALRYIASPQEIHGADVVILPGTKTTIEDLKYVKGSGLEENIFDHVRGGGEVMGICGGFQMLGQEISDPHRVETGGSAKGLELLNVRTYLAADKKTVQVLARPFHEGIATDCRVAGYEIHLGTTIGENIRPSFQTILPPNRSLANFSKQERALFSGQYDGAMSEDGRVWGTYIHGVFDKPEFRREWLNRVRRRKGLSPIDVEISKMVSTKVLGELDRWADHVEKHIDIAEIMSMPQGKDD